MNNISRSTVALSASFAIASTAATQVLARPGSAYPVALSVNFTVTGTTHFNAVDPAALTIKKGVVSGTVTVTAGTSPFPCTVTSGSTDSHGKLMLTCSVLSGLDTVSFTGKLKTKTGAGKGTFSETYYGETGKYTVAPAR
jgi:hypothetical protein